MNVDDLVLLIARKKSEFSGVYLKNACVILVIYDKSVLYILKGDEIIDACVCLGIFLGILLYGCSLIAIGMFVSSLTESQVVSAVLGIVLSMLIALMDGFSSMINNTFLSSVVEKLSFMGRFETFSAGILDFSNVIFFLSICAVFIFLTVRALEKKRWA